jgi:hypothetical protein
MQGMFSGVYKLSTLREAADKDIVEIAQSIQNQCRSDVGKAWAIVCVAEILQLAVDGFESNGKRGQCSGYIKWVSRD